MLARPSPGDKGRLLPATTASWLLRCRAASSVFPQPSATTKGVSDEMTSPARLKLPIGIQTFRKIREDGHYYVDKTAFLRRLLDEGTHYFLSRPRRFGKSLFLDTCKELLEGS